MYVSSNGEESPELFPNSNPNPSHSHFPDALIASIGLPFIVLTSVVTCLAFLKKTFRRFPFINSRSSAMEKERNNTGVKCTRAVSTSSEDLPTKKSFVLAVEEFRRQYREISADSYYRLSVEFEGLRINDISSHANADLGINRCKNRFVNVLPYDHSRVVLKTNDDDPPGSDYINANYIAGFYAEKEYIATQGPLKNTIQAFWKMIWQEDVRAIVMLTPCLDKEREKCVRYWPNTLLPEQYGNIQVEIVQESLESYDIAQKWIVTEFVLRSEEEERKIRHYQFITWPDFGAVDPPEALVHFIRQVRVSEPYPISQAGVSNGRKSHPIVVHCSAGVGRSGTFIAVDIMSQQIKHYQRIDVFGTVQRMRRERIWMVQTEQQYASIYRCANAIVLELEALEKAAKSKDHGRSIHGRESLTNGEHLNVIGLDLDHVVEMIQSGKIDDDALENVAKISF